MGKRSNFPRRKNDAYATPAGPVRALLPYLPPATHFVEPCAGDGALIDILISAGHVCSAAFDIAPRRGDVMPADATTLTVDDIDPSAAMFITNPAWTRSILHPVIVNLSDIRPTWLLFDADWPHTAQAAPYLPRLRRIVTAGRVKWIPDSAHAGKDNCCWYLFDARGAGPAIFTGRN